MLEKTKSLDAYLRDQGYDPMFQLATLWGTMLYAVGLNMILSWDKQMAFYGSILDKIF